MQPPESNRAPGRAEPTPAHASPPHAARPRIGAWLALNPSTLALLSAILLVTTSTELWAPLVPEYLKTLRRDLSAGAPATILLVACYGFARDLLEAINYYVGGAIGGLLNTRRSLLLFNLIPLAGLAILLVWRMPAAVFVALPLVFVWDSVAGPAIITVVGSSVPAERRTMAFSLQAIFRRVARGAAYLIGALTIWAFGRIGGFAWAVGIGVALLLAAVVIQARFMQTRARDTHAVLLRPRDALAALRRFDPELKRLLLADILARWAEGTPRELIILFCVPLLSRDHTVGTALYTSVLLTTQALTNVAAYLLVGPLASRAGTAKKPFIGLTFVFFALFPITIAMLGPSFGIVGLIVAFICGGLRELGEPARKAMISELVEPATRTQMIGLYWAARGVAVMPAALLGGVVWIGVNAVRPGYGPLATLWLGGVLGLLGAGYFYRRFGVKPRVVIPS